MVSKYSTNYKEPNIFFIYFAENVTVCTVQNAESLLALNCKVITKKYSKGTAQWRDREFSTL